jgi:hypothetical protein
MKYNKQSDQLWSNISMMLENDKIGNIGCYLTCLANILQTNCGMEFTPKKLNDILKGHDGYRFPSDTQDIDHASELNWKVICNMFNLIKEDQKYYAEEDKTYFIAEIHNYSPIYPQHFMNVVKKENGLFLLFDVYNGNLVYYKPEAIYQFKKIKFK